MTTVTINRALLEQARDALDVSRRFVYQDSRPQVDAAFDALRAELAKPVEQVEQNWNRSIRDSVDALLAEAGYQPDSSARHQLAMMNFDQKAQTTPAWHDAPTEPGQWACLYQGDISTAIFNAYEIENFDVEQMEDCRWYGPIPQDGEKS